MRDEATLLDVFRAGQLTRRFALDVPDAATLQADLKTWSAVLHQLLVMGEAVKRLSDDFTTARPEIPWRRMAGLRDVLIHPYDAVDAEVVWRVLTDDLPEVLTALEPLLPPRPPSEA